ncbi:MAG: nuclear transport factor 2 family protein [Gammaproteobacteria bacterium]
MSDERIAALEARLARLEDEEAVRRTWRDYCRCLDAEDWSGLADVYAPDGALEMVGLNGLVPGIDGVYRGREDIIQRFYAPAMDSAAKEASGLFATGHISTNMQVTLDGDRATTLAYFFEIVANDQVLIGTYQHRMRRDPDRWRFTFLRITVRYRARLAASEVGGMSLREILARPLP